MHENPTESESESDNGVQPDMESEAEDTIKTDEGNNTINNNKYNMNELALAIETDPNYSCLINAIHQLPDTQIKQLFLSPPKEESNRRYNHQLHVDLNPGPRA